MYKKLALITLVSLFFVGCAAVPYEQLKLDTTTNFRVPSPNMSGIYVYQWKSGIYGAGRDVEFEIKGQPTISLNTGEYGYFEVSPGEYEYKWTGGILGKQYFPVKFEANKNYFFHAYLLNFTDRANLIKEQQKIDEVKKDILNGKYEVHNAD
ncbi:DUF2846 domain-containing protein [Acinetobacter sp. VNH17]|uniref:DUF2846 domain-containing protein n=1 Tax=Acinetobacter thutiue TaxID=2998078 RepID=A0ABT7WNS4_9GAMM|nr:DUF2846 domain-containing protein [Acinetobacter thutiue]MCY6412205.1 DUF2846 domain-containing protein [Acinetobacter thutiue]MDN0014309.1 DUF2846 domain-containing protein [Acinetobacter thutiue]